jgi:hypothetical protein
MGVFGIVPRSSRFKKSTPLKKKCQPNTTSSSSSTVDLLQKNGGAGPNSMVLIECLKRYSTKSKFPGVGRNYPPLALVTQKTVRSSIFSPRRPLTPPARLYSRARSCPGEPSRRPLAARRARPPTARLWVPLRGPPPRRGHASTWPRPREVFCPGEVVRQPGRHGHGRAPRGPLPQRSLDPAATTLLHYLAPAGDVAIRCSTTSNDGSARFVAAETDAGVRFVKAGFRRSSGGIRVARPDSRSQASESSSPPRPAAVLPARRVLPPRQGRHARRTCKVGCLPSGEASPRQGRRARRADEVACSPGSEAPPCCPHCARHRYTEEEEEFLIFFKILLSCGP